MTRERGIEAALGALAEWLESLRRAETDRRARLAEEARARREHVARVLMAAFSTAVVALFWWLSLRA
jgi:hypothetical protein